MLISIVNMFLSFRRITLTSMQQRAIITFTDSHRLDQLVSSWLSIKPLHVDKHHPNFIILPRNIFLHIIVLSSIFLCRKASRIYTNRILVFKELLLSFNTSLECIRSDKYGIWFRLMRFSSNFKILKDRLLISHSYLFMYMYTDD